MTNDAITETDLTRALSYSMAALFLSLAAWALVLLLNSGLLKRRTAKLASKHSITRSIVVNTILTNDSEVTRSATSAGKVGGLLSQAGGTNGQPNSAPARIFGQPNQRYFGDNIVPSNALLKDSQSFGPIFDDENAGSMTSDTTTSRASDDENTDDLRRTRAISSRRPSIARKRSSVTKQLRSGWTWDLHASIILLILLSCLERCVYLVSAFYLDKVMWNMVELLGFILFYNMKLCVLLAWVRLDVFAYSDGSNSFSVRRLSADRFAFGSMALSSFSLFGVVLAWVFAGYNYFSTVMAINEISMAVCCTCACICFLLLAPRWSKRRLFASRVWRRMRGSAVENLQRVRSVAGVATFSMLIRSAQNIASVVNAGSIQELFYEGPSVYMSVYLFVTECIPSIVVLISMKGILQGSSSELTQSFLTSAARSDATRGDSIDDYTDFSGTVPAAHTVNDYKPPNPDGDCDRERQERKGVLTAPTQPIAVQPQGCESHEAVSHVSSARPFSGHENI